MALWAYINCQLQRILQDPWCQCKEQHLPSADQVQQMASSSQALASQGMLQLQLLVWQQQRRLGQGLEHHVMQAWKQKQGHGKLRTVAVQRGGRTGNRQQGSYCKVLAAASQYLLALLPWLQLLQRLLYQPWRVLWMRISTSHSSRCNSNRACSRRGKSRIVCNCLLQHWHQWVAAAGLRRL
jgi:hypothetical protein